MLRHGHSSFFVTGFTTESFWRPSYRCTGTASALPVLSSAFPCFPVLLAQVLYDPRKVRKTRPKGRREWGAGRRGPGC